MSAPGQWGACASGWWKAAALQARYRMPRLDGDGEAHLVTLACSEAPEGHARWTLRLLADTLVELEVVEAISHETVCQVLKKHHQTVAKAGRVHPTEANAEFVCAMEDVLEVYKRPFDPNQPLVCMDESSKQHIKEVRTPIPPQAGQPERFDTGYGRSGVSNLFIFFEPLTGQRHAAVTGSRTAVDWAHPIRHLLDVHHPDAHKATRVMDNPNTQAPASLYKAFEPMEARRLLERLEIHYTPKHGSWPDRAEIEFSHLNCQCLDRRIPDQATLQKETAAWVEKRNTSAKPVDWRFTTEDARIKLKRLYPSINS